jgi:hypothetical protein
VTRHLAAFGRFWWDFVVGDDWRIAAAVLAALAVGAILAAGSSLSDTAVSLLTGAVVVGFVGVTIIGGALAAAKRGR